jgi:hypothetical protein
MTSPPDTNAPQQEAPMIYVAPVSAFEARVATETRCFQQSGDGAGAVIRTRCLTR